MADYQPLSLFEGAEVVANVTAFGGTIKDPTLQPVGESPMRSVRVLLVVTVTDEVKFTDGELGRLRHHKEVISEAYDPSDHIDTAALLQQLRDENTDAIEARMALVAKDFGGDADGEGPEAAGSWEDGYADAQTAGVG
jgi:hypothetical protein